MEFQADLLGTPGVGPKNTETRAMGSAYLAAPGHQLLQINGRNRRPIGNRSHVQAEDTGWQITRRVEQSMGAPRPGLVPKGARVLANQIQSTSFSQPGEMDGQEMVSG
jgi:hypothetical protein